MALKRLVLGLALLSLALAAPVGANCSQMATCYYVGSTGQCWPNTDYSSNCRITYINGQQFCTNPTWCYYS